MKEMPNNKNILITLKNLIRAYLVSLINLETFIYRRKYLIDLQKGICNFINYPTIIPYTLIYIHGLINLSKPVIT